MNPDVEKYLTNLGSWQKELETLQQIIAKCGLTEEFKWKHPSYSDNKKNILLLHGFTNYCAILFHKGALLSDSKKILVQQTKNIQAARQLRFTNLAEIIALEPLIKQYVYEAIEVERAGLTVQKKTTSEYETPEELTLQFEENPALEQAFNTLTEGRKRGYLLHFSQPKQSKTRISRIQKNTGRILNGKGLNDCVCGWSKRMPNCDGAHNQHKK